MRISAFMRRLTRADLVVAIISDKYLRSPNCMKEIYEIWQRCQGDLDEMVERVVPVVLPEVRISTLWERQVYADHWAAEEEKVNELERQKKLLRLGVEAFQEARLIREFANHVHDILSFIQDVLMPRSLDVHFDNGFEAVREAVWRRVGERSESPGGA